MILKLDCTSDSPKKLVKNGKCFSGTTIKDTWTKPRGRVEAREGGGFGWGLGERRGKMQTTVIEQQ